MSTIFFLALRRPPVKAGELVQFGRLNNVFKKWMWGVRNDTICWFFWMLSKLSGWPHDIFLIWIPYLGRGGAIQCRLCGTWGGIAAISAKEASKGPLGFDSWQPPLNVVICHIELKCFEPDSMFEWTRRCTTVRNSDDHAIPLRWARTPIYIWVNYEWSIE